MTADVDVTFAPNDDGGWIASVDAIGCWAAGETKAAALVALARVMADHRKTFGDVA